MLAFIANLFVLLIYQPLFNVVVFCYWVTGQVTNNPNMGAAIIMLTIVVRLLLLPESLHSIKNERKRVGLQQDVEKLEHDFAGNPIELDKRKKALFRSSPGMVAGEMFSLAIQIMIAVMLWRMFSTGLSGGDLPLIYPFMPYVATPYNLMFRGIDLALPSFTTNFVLMVSLFIMETLSVMAAIPGSLSRSRAIKAQLLLPIISFCFFYFMPAGKQIFVIISVWFSIVLTFGRLIVVKFDLYKFKQAAKVTTDPTSGQVLVETK